MPTTFAKPVNNFATVLASAHVSGDNQLVLASAAGLGSLPAGRVFRVTALSHPNTSAEVVLCIFEANVITGNTLTILAAAEGFMDVGLPSGTAIQIRWTAKDASEIQGAVNTLESAGYITGNQTITLSGDASGSGTTAITVALAAAGTAGTYTKVTTDAKGRVTSGTVLAAGDIPNIAESQVTNLVSDLALKAPLASPAHTGTMTFAGATSGTTGLVATATASGTLTLPAATGTLATQTFVTSQGYLSGTVAIANGGTGQTTASTAFNALAPSQASQSGKYLTTDGTNTSWATVSGGGGTPAGPSGSVQYDASGSFGAFGSWDGSNVFAITTSAAEFRVAQDSTHYSRWTRSATGNTAHVYNTVNQPAATSYSLSFNGSTGYVNVPDASSLNFGSGDFTYSAWVKTTGNARTSIASKYDSSNGAGNIFDLLATGIVRFALNTTPSVYAYRDSSSAVNDGSWHSVVGVRSGATVHIYIDGSLADGSLGTGGSLASTSTATPFLLAHPYNGGPNAWYPGKIKDVRVYGRALSSGEASTIASGGDPATTNLVLHLRDNEGSGTAVVDNSGQANTGTINGGVTWSTDVPSQNPGVPGASLVEAQVVKTRDGTAAAESGIHTLGDPGGRSEIAFGTTLDLVLPGGTQTLAYASGALGVAAMADSAAPNSSLYLSTSHLDGASAPKLCRKDASGNVTVIG